MSYSQVLLPCMWKQLFGISCPLCGFQRSIILLCSGQWLDAMYRFPPLIPLGILLGVMVFQYVHDKRIREWTGWSALTVLILNGIYQNIT